jgi:hypothetical protein
LGLYRKLQAPQCVLRGGGNTVLKAVLLQGRIIGILKYSFNDHLRRLYRKCGNVIVHAYVRIPLCEVYIVMYYHEECRLLGCGAV